MKKYLLFLVTMFGFVCVAMASGKDYTVKSPDQKVVKDRHHRKR